MANADSSSATVGTPAKSSNPNQIESSFTRIHSTGENMEVDGELLTLLAEQQRELTAAKIAESDLDYAFQLQMQEAMNASVTLNPSSSSPSPSDFQFQNDDVSNAGLAHLLYEEIERFQRERSDFEQVQLETKRMQEDLNRRIHDQAFARELLAVPEMQWRNTGEYFQKPYGEGSSNGASNTESFRLYVKGLVHELMVGNSLVGIGVAICDSTDNLIFEVGKPLIGVETSREVVEMKALIEGLNAAVSLGIKRITIFCGDNSLYQYITGKTIPRQSQIRMMADQVTLLQRKFTQCNPALFAPNNVKFAYKLAQEAVASQAWKVQSRRAKNITENCAVCLEDTNVDNMFSVDTCLHRYCFSCMKKHVEAKLHQAILPKCPHEGCKSELKLNSCQKFLTPELFDIMSQRIKEASIPARLKFYCPYPKCSALMSKADPHLGQVGPQQCSKCRGLFCIHCNVPWHMNMNCFQYKRLNPYPVEEEAKLKNLAASKRWRQCTKCNHMVELAEGCYHIYCRCGYEFCYTCGAEWKNKRPTCKCPIWDEQNIIYATQNNNNVGIPRQR